MRLNDSEQKKKKKHGKQRFIRGGKGSKCERNSQKAGFQMFVKDPRR